jgi:ribose transport system permease protein
MQTGTKTEKPEKSVMPKGISAFLGNYIIVLPIILLIVVWTIVAPNFMTYSNWMNILRQVSMIAILAAGAFFIMATGDFDLGLASVVGLSGCVFAKLIVSYGWNPGLAAIVTLLMAIGCGMINGVMVTVFGIPAFIATLGMQYVARGLCYVVTNSYPISGLPESIAWFGRGYLSIGGVDLFPWPVIFMVLVYAITAFVAAKTKFGRYVYAVGGNAEAAYLSGINAKKIKRAVFTIGGLAAGLVGMILVSRLSSGQPQGGTGWEFKAVIAVVMGGVSLSGGKGKPIGVALGAIFVGILENGMTLLNVNSYYQQVVQGIVLVVAIGFDVYKNKRQAESK